MAQPRDPHSCLRLAPVLFLGPLRDAPEPEDHVLVHPSLVHRHRCRSSVSLTAKWASFPPTHKRITFFFLCLFISGNPFLSMVWGPFSCSKFLTWGETRSKIKSYEIVNINYYFLKEGRKERKKEGRKEKGKQGKKERRKKALKSQG